MLKKVMYSVKTGIKTISANCMECGSAKLAYDPHGIKFCKNCGIVVEDWMNG